MTTLLPADGLQTACDSGGLTLQDSASQVVISGKHFRFAWDRHRGKLAQVWVDREVGADPNDTFALIPDGQTVGYTWDLPVSRFDVEPGQTVVLIRVRHEDASWRIDAEYEVHQGGYVVCTFEMTALADHAEGRPMAIQVPLDEHAVFSRQFQVKNTSDDPERRQSSRGMAVDFTVDERPVSHSLDFLLESVTHNLNGKPCWRRFEARDGFRELGWKLTSGWAYPFPKGYTYRNRWCLTVTAMDCSANPVRGQRIVHWSSQYPHFPADSHLDEMAEYGTSVLILHMPSLKHISGSEPMDASEMHRTVQGAQARGMKALFYCQPYLISTKCPDHGRLQNQRTECLNVWQAQADSQIVFYEPDDRFDADELCLRCPEAFDYIYQSVLDCYETYGFDGLYIDWSWPAQGLCSDPSHGHDPGLFNFYDYLRIHRMWRQALGPKPIMIGHGGGFLVGSDMIEGYDACLTGEAQEQLAPSTIGQHYGTAPTLWTFQRRKQDIFRSATTIEQLIRQAMTPHVGLGITGTAVTATMDVASHPQMMALWQMWRAFPVDRARVFHYLTPHAVELDNDEVVYSLWVTPEGHALLLLANTGGPRADDAPAIGVNLQLDLKRLGLSDGLRAWRLRGETYETFRIAEIEPVCGGRLTVQELGIHEFVGYVLSPNQPPAELIALIEHLDGRAERAGSLWQGKQQRLRESDQLLDGFAKSPHAHIYFSYKQFMEGRVVE